MNKVWVPGPGGAVMHGRYEALLGITEAIASHRELETLFVELARRLNSVVQFDFANLILYDATCKVMKSPLLDS